MSGLGDVGRAAEEHRRLRADASEREAREKTEWLALQKELEDKAIRVARVAAEAGVPFNSRSRYETRTRTMTRGFGPFKREVPETVSQFVPPSGYRINLQEKQQLGYLCFEVTPLGDVKWLVSRHRDTSSGSASFYEWVDSEVIPGEEVQIIGIARTFRQASTWSSRLGPYESPAAPDHGELLAAARQQIVAALGRFAAEHDLRL